MEQGHEVRIVGSASAEKKEQAKKEIRQALFDHLESLPPQEREQLEKLEYPKSKREIALIDFANKETSRLMREAGIESHNVPVENFHIIPPELYKKAVGDSGIAATFHTQQGIIFDAQYFRDNPVNFGTAVFHELLHLKAHLSMEVQEEGNKVHKTPYRAGTTVNALQSHGYHGKYHQHFVGLHEGIVAEAEKRFLGQLFDCPALAPEKEWMASDEAKEMRAKLAKEKEIPEDDIVWVGKKGENDWTIISYAQQRNVLNYMCVEIQKQFSDEYQSANDVYQIFLNAHFTGRLLPLARLVEQTFGEGSFRSLGNMDDERQSGVLHLESLKKARARRAREKSTSSAKE